MRNLDFYPLLNVNLLSKSQFYICEEHIYNMDDAEEEDIDDTIDDDMMTSFPPL